MRVGMQAQWTRKKWSTGRQDRWIELCGNVRVLQVQFYWRIPIPRWVSAREWYPAWVRRCCCAHCACACGKPSGRRICWVHRRRLSGRIGSGNNGAWLAIAELATELDVVVWALVQAIRIQSPAAAQWQAVELELHWRRVMCSSRYAQRVCGGLFLWYIQETSMAPGGQSPYTYRPSTLVSCRDAHCRRSHSHR